MINLYGNIAEDKTVNATGSYNATATDRSGVWAMQVATFGGSLMRMRESISKSIPSWSEP